MQTQDFYYLGKVLRTSGNKGEVLVRLDADDPAAYKELKSVYLEIYGERIPFFIDCLELRNGGTAILSLSGVNSREEAAEFTGLQMFLPLSNLPPLNGNNFYYHEVIGFTVIDRMKGELGKLESVIDLPQNALFRILSGGNEILIPAAGEIIKEVDRDNRTIIIQAPEGLIDIYL